MPPMFYLLTVVVVVVGSAGYLALRAIRALEMRGSSNEELQTLAKRLHHLEEEVESLSNRHHELGESLVFTEKLISARQHAPDA